VHRDVVGRITLYLVLRFIGARMNGIAFELDPGCNDADDSPADSSRFGIPTDVIADLEP